METQAPLGAIARHQKNLVMLLESIGWEIRELKIDIAAQHAVVRLHRADGRWLYVDYSPRGAVVERWQRRSADGRTNERKPVPVNVLTDEFLGRIRCPEVRSALREMCNYVALNPLPGLPQLQSSQIRKALGPLI